MQIVIDIDDNYYELIKHDVQCGNDYLPFKLIAKGTPLPTGRWTASPLPDDWVGTLYTCSNCGAVEDSRSSYCPRCGAKMEEQKA